VVGNVHAVVSSIVTNQLQLSHNFLSKMTLNMFYKLLVPLLVVGITVGVLWVNPGHTVEAEVRNEREWESESENETNAARLHYRMISNR
jgi:hypothetical protein